MSLRRMRLGGLAAVAVSLALAPAAFATAGDLVPPRNQPTGADNPGAVAVGDFNGDGKDDLVVAHGVPTGPVSILLGNGAGDFSPAPTSPETTGNGAGSVVVADFDVNGTADLAIASGASKVTIFLGNGAGDFSLAPTSPEATSSTPDTVAVGDFNADGKPDLVTTNQFTNNLTILLGAGGGDFNPAATSPEAVGSTPEGVAVGDFNADGKADLAATRPGFDNVEILLGNGAGDFAIAPTSPEPAGDLPRQVVVGDFNGDGRPDLAIANQTSDNVTVLLSAGGGDFTPTATSPTVGDVPVALAIADFQHDGFADLAVANSIGDTVTTLLGNGTGDFSPSPSSPELTGDGPQGIARGDFNQDGVDDFAVTASNIDSVSILLGVAHPLSLNPTGSGGGFVASSPAGIDCGRNDDAHTDCSNLYASGARITLTADPDSGSGFDGFIGGGCTGSGVACTVTLDQAFVVNAIFRDTKPPKTEITKKPKKKTSKEKAKIKFTASEKKSTFTCKLDKGKARRCSTPFRKRVKPGKHRFRVFATDAAGNADRTPAKVRWMVLED